VARASNDPGAARRPTLGFWQLWNLSFGFFGIQIGFALQGANVSRIFQTLGASIDALPILWIAAPVTGLLLQPVIGHMSDRTWGRLGRRRPYFLAGATLSSLALLLFPSASSLWIAAGLLWLLDASINVTMEPFRAFVGDMVDDSQRTRGYALQTAFIGSGAVLASLAPAFLTRLGVANTAGPGEIPPSVAWAFYLGAVALFAAVLWTVLRTREYSREELTRYGVAPATGEGGGMLAQLLGALAAMPAAMRRLALVQFLSWLGFFIFWIYATPIITQYQFGAADPASQAYNDGANWVGVLFAVYNGVAALYSFVMPALAERIGAARLHAVNLVAGAAGLISIAVIRDPMLLTLSMLGIGMAWGSILTIPYSLLSVSLPQAKLGTYMGLFNMFIVLPQLVVSTVMGTLARSLYPDAPAGSFVVAAGCFAAAAVAMLAFPKK
jgi:maltose/moltooligosaccharide transporter